MCRDCSLGQGLHDFTGGAWWASGQALWCRLTRTPLVSQKQQKRGLNVFKTWNRKRVLNVGLNPKRNFINGTWCRKFQQIQFKMSKVSTIFFEIFAPILIIPVTLFRRRCWKYWEFMRILKISEFLRKSEANMYLNSHPQWGLYIVQN